MEKNEKGSTGKKTAEHYIPALRRFYQNLSIYLKTNVVLVIVWLLSGDSYFWPIWVMIGWGIPILFMAYEAGVLPPFLHDFLNSMSNSIPCMKNSWVEEKARKMADRDNKGRSFGEGFQAPKKETVAVKKAAPAKKVSPAKKAAAKPAILKTKVTKKKTQKKK